MKGHGRPPSRQWRLFLARLTFTPEEPHVLISIGGSGRP